MDAFTNFLANNYVWFLIISLILIFALIGYLVDKKDIKTGKRRNKREELKIVDFSSIDQSKSLSQSITEDAGGTLVLGADTKKEENSIETNENIEAPSEETTEESAEKPAEEVQEESKTE